MVNNNNPNGRYGKPDIKVPEGYKALNLYPGIITLVKVDEDV